MSAGAIRRTGVGGGGDLGDVGDDEDGAELDHTVVVQVGAPQEALDVVDHAAVDHTVVVRVEPAQQTSDVTDHTVVVPARAEEQEVTRSPWAPSAPARTVALETYRPRPVPPLAEPRGHVPRVRSAHHASVPSVARASRRLARTTALVLVVVAVVCAAGLAAVVRLLLVH